MTVDILCFGHAKLVLACSSDMKFGCLPAAAFAVMLQTTSPSAASTWVTASMYVNDSGRQQILLQVDTSTIVKRNGWTFVNSRLCVNHMRDCRDARNVEANCDRGMLTYLRSPVYTRVDGDEWWLGHEIEEGTRYPIRMPKGLVELEKKSNPREDRFLSYLFDFMCRL